MLQHLVAPAVAAALFAFVPAPPPPVLPEIDLSWDKDTYEAGELATLTICGTPGDIPVLIANSKPGPSFIAKVGELGVSLDDALIVVLPALPDDGKMDLLCDLKCDSPIELLQMPFWTQVITLDPDTWKPSGKSNVAILDVVAGDCGLCVRRAVADPECYGAAHQHAFWMPGIGTDFVFVSGGQLTERADGTAKLTGVIARESDGSQAFMVDIDFTGRIRPGEPAPPGSPKKELFDECYKDEGPVCPETWHYYETTDGTLTGLDCFEGARIGVSRHGAAFQVGFGANGKNTHYGASAWIDLELLAQSEGDCEIPWDLPKGDINVDLGGDCVVCATSAGDHALAIPDIAKDLVFVEGGEFTEFEDGTARLTGTVENVLDAGCRWIVEVDFSDRVAPLGPAPDGSPKLQLPPAVYAPGGPVDPSTWHYYETFEGTLVGEADKAGAEIAITRKGPAMQVGLGASGKTIKYGASAWFFLEVISQPDVGSIPDPLPGDGDINIALRCP